MQINRGALQSISSEILMPRFLETNNLKRVKALSAGGTPALLDQFILRARSESFHPHPFFFPHPIFL